MRIIDKKRCTSCGKFPFCQNAKTGMDYYCNLWREREVNLKLENNDETGFTFIKI